MSDTNAKPERSWQDIVADASQEHNPEKLIELSEELERALDCRKKTLHLAVNSSPGAKKKSGQ
jgi:hypothetical protein